MFSTEKFIALAAWGYLLISPKELERIFFWYCLSLGAIERRIQISFSGIYKVFFVSNTTRLFVFVAMTGWVGVLTPNQSNKTVKSQAGSSQMISDHLQENNKNEEKKRRNKRKKTVKEINKANTYIKINLAFFILLTSAMALVFLMNNINWEVHIT